METSGHSESGETSDLSSSQGDSSERTWQRPHHHSMQTRIRDPHPLGFKALIQRVEKFSGHEGTCVQIAIALTHVQNITIQCTGYICKKH